MRRENTGVLYEASRTTETFVAVRKQRNSDSRGTLGTKKGAPVKAKRNAHNGRLEEAIAMLVQTQATFVQNQAAFQAQLSETERENSKRFARIEAILMEHSRILAEHSRILEELPETLAQLPEAVRQKIGFKAHK